MPVILTATDYSDIANHAVHYACALAKTHNASVTVVHSFIIPIVIGTDTPMPAISVDEARDMATERMDELMAELEAAHPGVDINSHVTYGDITDSLDEYTETAQPWLIVIGNSSSEDNNFWPGSNLLNALKELPYMVLAVPPEANYTEVKNICFACDFKNTSEQLPAGDLLKLVADTHAKLNVLNVHQGTGDQEGVQAEMNKLKEVLAPANPEYHFVSSESIDDGIQQFVADNNMDWLVIIPHKHSFFEGLLHHSHTKAMARMSHVPLLALHSKA
ncbi:MAG: universal stress protein [Sphingobacteriales bacterium]|nr:MAG: universal stress protein [Sphingobacteriales bacterium]